MVSNNLITHSEDWSTSSIFSQHVLRIFLPIPSHNLVVIIIYCHSFHELFGTGICYHRKLFNWALSKLSNVPFLPSKDCWSAPYTCCVGSHCFNMFLSAPVVWLHRWLPAACWMEEWPSSVLRMHTTNHVLEFQLIEDCTLSSRRRSSVNIQYQD